MSVYPNPRALHALPYFYIPTAAHHYFDEDNVLGHMPAFHPAGSITKVVAA